jgi:hypothetical protein
MIAFQMASLEFCKGNTVGVTASNMVRCIFAKEFVTALNWSGQGLKKRFGEKAVNVRHESSLGIKATFGADIVVAVHRY